MFINQIISFILDNKGSIDIIYPSSNLSILNNNNNNSIKIMHLNSFYHHLLPGVLITLNLKSLNDFNKNKKNLLNFFEKNKFYFSLFKSCFNSLFNIDIKPPINSLILNYKLNSIKKSNKNLNKQFLNNSILHKNLILPVIAVSYIIGKNGKSIELIRKQTNAKIKVHDLIDNNSQLISLIGSKNDIEFLESLIQDKLIQWKKDFLFKSYR